MKKSTKPSNLETSQGNVDIGQIAGSLQVIARSLGAIALRLSHPRPKSDAERIDILTGLGFENKEIATMLGTTIGTVQVRRSVAAKTLRGKGKSTKKVTGKKASKKATGKKARR